MGKQNDMKSLTRRDVLKLAGTAAAFCTSFGFLHGGQTGGALESQNIKLTIHKELQLKWQQAEIKWYKGNEVLNSTAVPATVLKYLGSDLNATIEIKLFRAGQMLKNLGTLEAKH
jgi:hypothetical protein